MMKKILFASSLALLLCGCENKPDTPEEPGKPELPAGIEQIVEDLNAGLTSLRTFTDAAARSSVSTLTDTDTGAELLFSDGTRVTLVCDASATATPLIGMAADGGVYYWTLASQPQSPWLEDAAGERMAVAQTLPVMGVDDDGFWTVTTAAKAAPWRITDATGNPVAATGEERTVQFRTVALVEGRVEVALTGGGVISADKITDLSADATANCYLVTTPGRYCFDASVRGNGAGDESLAGFVPQIVLSDGMTADWLWTDSEGLVTAIELDKTAGTIAFTLGEGEGNALIALVDGGEVVWSWHIWATDAPQTMTYENGAQLLDRNLGATDTTPGSADAFGMYYQWGRKDPFYGGTKTETSATAFAEAKANTVVNPAYAALTWNFNKTTTTVAGAAAHPMTHFHNTVGTSSNWLAAPKTTLWGAAKTLNDPCPVGYKVPAVAAWDDVSSGNRYIAGVSAWDATNLGMTYTYNGHTAWYPAQGYRNYSTGSIVGIGGSAGGSGAYWASEVASVKSCYFWFRSPISSSSGEINTSLDKERSYGYAVRCCKE